MEDSTWRRRCRWDYRYECEPPKVNHAFASQVVLGSDAGSWQTSAVAADQSIRNRASLPPALPPPRSPRAYRSPRGPLALSMPPTIASPRLGNPIKGELPGKATLFDQNFSFVHHEPPWPSHYRKEPQPPMAEPTALSGTDRRHYRRSVLLRMNRFPI